MGVGDWGLGIGGLGIGGGGLGTVQRSAFSVCG